MSKSRRGHEILLLLRDEPSALLCHPWGLLLPRATILMYTSGQDDRQAQRNSQATLKQGGFVILYSLTGKTQAEMLLSGQDRGLGEGRERQVAFTSMLQKSAKGLLLIHEMFNMFYCV